MEERTVVEINGVKMEVDLRTARTIDTYKVGDRVKVLVKKYSDTYETHHGVIVAFDNFENLPTITVCYITTGYNGDLSFSYINEKNKAKFKKIVEFEKVAAKKYAELTGVKPSDNILTELKHVAENLVFNSKKNS